MDNIITYAKKIAQYQQYPRLEHGLQPIEDYAEASTTYEGLNTKYQRECLKLRDMYAEWQSGTKTQWHVLYKASDVYYYSRQLEEQSGQPLWPVAYASVRLYLPYEWTEREVEAAADVKYAWRSLAPGNKDIDYELQLIQERIELLPPLQRRVGRPISLRDQVVFNIRTISAEAAAYIDETRGEQTRRARLEEIVLDHKKRAQIDLTN